MHLLVFLIFLLISVSSPSAQTANPSPSASKERKKSEQEKSVKEILKDFGYPELQVVPRASQRLKMERKAEESNYWYVHWTFQLSAASSLISASTASSHFSASLSADDKKAAGDVADGLQLTSLLWLGGMSVLSFDKPYATASKDLSRTKGKSKSAQLMRERLAEESLEKSSQLITTLRYASLVTNLLGNVALAGYVDGPAKVYTLVGASMAFLPLLFEHRYRYNWRVQREYKQKIFAPLSSISIQPDSEGRWQPHWTLTFHTP